jgi:hypothetical protein
MRSWIHFAIKVCNIDGFGPELIRYRLPSQNQILREIRNSPTPSFKRCSEPLVLSAHFPLENWPIFNRLLGFVPGFEAVSVSYSYHLMEVDRKRGIIRSWGSGEENFDPELSDEEMPSVRAECRGFTSLEPTLDLRKTQVSRLLSSYVRSLHRLCPLFDLDRVYKMVRQFSSSYSPTDNENFAKPDTRIEYSLSNVIVLLIFALGEVCQHKTSLPVPDNSSSNALENTNNLPGMAYYAVAESILGPLRGSPGVQCAKAMILAALFQNQYGRISVGWGYLQQACSNISVHVKRQVSLLPLRTSLLTEQAI